MEYSLKLEYYEYFVRVFLLNNNSPIIRSILIHVYASMNRMYQMTIFTHRLRLPIVLTIVIMVELFEHSALGYVVGCLAYMIVNRLTQRYIVGGTLHAERYSTKFWLCVIDV